MGILVVSYCCHGDGSGEFILDGDLPIANTTPKPCSSNVTTARPDWGTHPASSQHGAGCVASTAKPDSSSDRPSSTRLRARRTTVAARSLPCRLLCNVCPTNGPASGPASPRACAMRGGSSERARTGRGTGTGPRSSPRRRQPIYRSLDRLGLATVPSGRGVGARACQLAMPRGRRAGGFA